MIVGVLRGGPSVGQGTLNRFFAAHVLVLPLLNSLVWPTHTAGTGISIAIHLRHIAIGLSIRTVTIKPYYLVLLGFGWRSRAVFPAPLVLEGTGSKLRRIRESYWCARWPSYGSSQPPILQAIATAVETTPFIGTLRRNPISIRHSGGISIPRLEAFKADTSCGSSSMLQGCYPFVHSARCFWDHQSTDPCYIMHLQPR